MAWFRRGAQSAEDEFADEVAGLARDLLGAKVARRGEFSLLLELPGGPAVTMNLHNIYAEASQMDADGRAERLRRAVLGMMPGPRPATWKEAARRLLPAVRSASWANAMVLPVEAPGGPLRPPFGRPLVPFVKVLCAIDSEHSIAFATDADLAAWGVTDDEAIRTASDNLARMRFEVRRSGPTAMILGPDGYISSWLAVPAALARVAADIGDTVVAVAADRDQLLLIDADHPEALAGMLEPALEHYPSAPRRLSPVPYLVSETGITPWLPAGDHPARPLADTATHILAATEYADQQARLEQQLGEAGEDVYVARHTLMRDQDSGQMWSWAAWVKEVTNGLLPRVDVVMFGGTDNPKTRFAVRWHDAVRLAGDTLVEEPGFDPPRWRYRRWPDGPTLAALQTHAVQLPPRA
jgi:hypothetical protein